MDALLLGRTIAAPCNVSAHDAESGRFYRNLEWSRKLGTFSRRVNFSGCNMQRGFDNTDRSFHQREVLLARCCPDARCGVTQPIVP